jgi:transaldolase
VQLVTEIYNCYKKWGIRTEIMGASFRHVGQITALAGCDLLTISPDLLATLAACTEPLTPALQPARAPALEPAPMHTTQAAFRLALNENAMATEKLAEGIRIFCADTTKLTQLLLSI